MVFIGGDGESVYMTTRQGEDEQPTVTNNNNPQEPAEHQMIVNPSVQGTRQLLLTVVENQQALRTAITENSNGLDVLRTTIDRFGETMATVFRSALAGDFSSKESFLRERRRAHWVAHQLQGCSGRP